MSDTLVITLIAVFGGMIFLLLHRSGKARKAEILQHGYHTQALVTDYREEVARVAGSWTSLEYPYVTYITESGEVKVDRLRYASSQGQWLWLGQEIEIVVYQQQLFYLPALKQSLWAHLIA